jgi:nitrite reductase/ring-hydroxylating ferredoxin subunit
MPTNRHTAPTRAPHAPSDDCTGCAIAGRRRFVRDVAVLAAGALLSLGAAPAEAAAATWSVVRGRRAGRSGKAYPIPAADGVHIDNDESVIVARFQGSVYGFSLACPHQNTALRWESGDQEFRCPKHHSEYTPTGEFIDGRATRGMDRFAVTRDGNNVVVNLDVLFRQDEDPDAWKKAFIAL